MPIKEIRVPVGKVDIFMLVLLWKIVVSLNFPRMKGNLLEENSVLVVVLVFLAYAHLG